MEPFEVKPLNAAQALAKQLNDAENMKRSALRYSSHLGSLLREACDILEKLDTEFEVSEPLQMWWEREKRKREAKACYLLSQPTKEKPEK